MHFIKPGTPTQSSQVLGVDGSLIGMDLRPSDNRDSLIYCLTDNGTLYLINVSSTPYRATLVSTLTPRFASGYQSLADFNPTNLTNALRVIGSNDQNFAVIGANLHQTVVQNPLRYVLGDPSFTSADPTSPNITAGAYDTNIAGALSTTFYMLDYDVDTLVTIADRNAAGSSNTGGGQLKTLGPLVDEKGNPINIAPTVGLDIYTSAAGVNVCFIVSGQNLYCLDLASFNPDAPVGTQQKILLQRLPAYSQEIARVARGGPST